MTLYIRTLNDDVKALLSKQIEKHRYTDSGFDIPLPAQNVDLSQNVVSFPLGIQVAAVDGEEPRPCLLLPRSSIYKTPFRLCNSIGLVDAGYRGEVKAIVDNMTSEDDTTLRLEDGTRMFQICRHDFLPWKQIILSDDLPVPPDDRGSGGFGSTGGGLQLENHPRT